MSKFVNPFGSSGGGGGGGLDAAAVQTLIDNDQTNQIVYMDDADTALPAISNKGYPELITFEGPGNATIGGRTFKRGDQIRPLRNGIPAGAPFAGNFVVAAPAGTAITGSQGQTVVIDHTGVASTKTLYHPVISANGPLQILASFEGFQCFFGGNVDSPRTLPDISTLHDGWWMEYHNPVISGATLTFSKFNAADILRVDATVVNGFTLEPGWKIQIQSDGASLDVSVEKIQSSVAFEYPTDAARTAETGYTVTLEDIYLNRMFLQTDTTPPSVWLADGNPGAVIWRQISAGGSPALDAQDLTIVGHAVAADATASAPQITTFVGGTYGRNEGISVSADTLIDARILTPGLWYFPEDSGAGAADVNDLVVLPSGRAGNFRIVTAHPGTILPGDGVLVTGNRAQTDTNAADHMNKAGLWVANDQNGAGDYGHLELRAGS